MADNAERWTAEQTAASRATLRDDLQYARRKIERVTDEVRTGRQWYLFSIAGELPRRAIKMVDLVDPRRPLERFDWFEIYCPRERVSEAIPQRELSKKQRAASGLLKPTRLVERALLPGYAFGCFDYERDPWRALFKLARLDGIACEDGKPVPLLPGVVEALRGLEVNGAIPGDTPIKAIPLLLGEEIRITEGPFAGFTGTIDALPDICWQDVSESTKLRVLVGLFGRKTRTELTIAQIEKL